MVSVETSQGIGNKRKAISAIERSFNIGARERLSSEIARMFYSSGLPFNLARNPYYFSAFQYAADNQISGFKAPGYNALRTTLLQKERAHVETLIQPIKGKWNEKGISIVTDGWTDVQRRPLINFMAVSDGGPIFLKSVDCSGEYKDKVYIANQITQTIDEVGPQNVVQIITDNAPVCKAAGAIIEGRYEHIFWSPCVVHTLNLALKNICAAKNTERNEDVYNECHWITEINDEAMFIRSFILSHNMRLAMYNSFVSLKLLAIAETRFASTIVMLKRLMHIKTPLQKMVISPEWNTYKMDDVGKARKVRELILDESWWDKVDYILSFTKPIYDMLQYCDTDKPTLHLVYDMWDSMIVEVKKIIYQQEGKQAEDMSIFYNVVHEILNDRWAKRCTPLHCLAHSLNPKYYSEEWLSKGPNRVPPHRDTDVSIERSKCFRRYFKAAEDRKILLKEYSRFSGTTDEFSQFDSLQDRWALEPKEWWLNYGASVPNLQGLALKLLGQPCSSSCCERNWSTYSIIHSMKRNKLTTKRAEDLVFVHSNLHLLSRNSEKYANGESKMWDVVGDGWEPFHGAGALEVASLSIDEPDFEKDLLDDGESIDDN